MTPEQENRYIEILRDAVLCEDATDFVLLLIDEAERLGLTKDRRTLCE